MPKAPFWKLLGNSEHEPKFTPAPKQKLPCQAL